MYVTGAVAAVLGVVLIVVRQTTELIHPHSDSGNPAVAFADYAAFDYWVVGHLIEFLAWSFVFGALVVLSWRLRSSRAAGWGMLGAAGGVASLSVIAVLQAVDGVALKVMVDRWAEASGESRELLFEGAFAVRQIEGGLLAMAFLVAGLTVILYGIAIFVAEESPSWLGVLGVLAGLLSVVAGVDAGHDPFGATTMRLGFLNVVALVWVVLVARFLLQSSRRPFPRRPVPE